MKMKSIGKLEAQILHKEINDALDAIAKKHGLMSIRTGTFTYDNCGMFFKMSMEGKVDPTGENGQMTTTAINSTTANILQSLGTPLNSLCLFNGDVYRVVGYNSRRRTQPIDLMNTRTNTQAKAAVSSVKNAIASHARIQAARANAPANKHM